MDTPLQRKRVTEKSTGHHRNATVNMIMLLREACSYVNSQQIPSPTLTCEGSCVGCEVGMYRKPGPGVGFCGVG
jgi:hypothetical protein